MRARFKGEADGLPCEVFGFVFPVGEWVDVGKAAPKLAGNPMFDTEGAPKPVAPKPAAPEPEPDPVAERDALAPVVAKPPVPAQAAVAPKPATPIPPATNAVTGRL